MTGHVALGAGVEHDRRGLGVVEHVELGRRRGVADVTPPPMKTTRPIRPNASGCTRASSARLVIGASGTTVTRSPAAAPRRRWCRAAGPAPARVGAQGGGRHPEVAPSRRRRARGGRRPGPRAAAARRPTPTGTSPRPAASSTVRVLRTTSARGALPPTQVTARRSRPGCSAGEQQRAGVVHTGVDVEDHGEGAPWGRSWRMPCAARDRRVRTAVGRRGRACSLLSTAPRPGRSAFGGRARSRTVVGCLSRRPDPALPAGSPSRPPACWPSPSPGAPATRPAPTPTRSPRGRRRPARPARHPPSPTAPPDPAAACVAETVDGLTADQRRGPAPHGGLRRQRPARAPSTTSSATSHVGNVIYLGGLGRGRQGDPNLGPRPGAGVRHEHGRRRPARRRRPGGRRSSTSCAARASPGRRPPAAGARWRRRADRGRRRWAEELKAAGVNVNLAPVTDTVPEDIGRANEPIGKWGRQYGSTPEAVSRSADGVPRGDARGRRRGNRQALPRAGAHPQQHRLLLDRHHRRRRRPRTTRSSSRSPTASRPARGWS